MKSIVIYFLYFIISVFCQEPVKGNNVILVRGVSFKTIKEALLDSGIFIDQQNEEDGTIITKRKGYCECPNKDFYQLIYFIRVKDSVATIRGKFSQQVQIKLFNVSPNTDDKDDFMEAIFWKSKSSTYNYIFGIMTQFARSLNPSSIEFKTL
jgi:hypothetical protein